MNGLALLEQLVRIPSPTGSEAGAVRFLQRRAHADGFRVMSDPAGNFVAETGTGDKLLLVVGHIDTVPGQIPVHRENGTLWGRGTVDAKGPLVAAYMAALRHKDDPRLRIRIVGAVDEEGHSRGARAIPADLNPAWILIGEPSGSHALTIGYKGILRGAFHVEQPRSHGAHREPSAVEAAIEFWRTVEATFHFQDHYDTIQGRLDAVHTTSDGLTDHVEVRFNLRLPPQVDPNAAEAELEALAHARGVRVEVEERMRGALASRKNHLVAAFVGAIRSRGAVPHFKRKTGTADFNLLAERHPDVPIVAYGPGDAALDHTPNERVEMAEFDEAVSVLDQVLNVLGHAATP